MPVKMEDLTAQIFGRLFVIRFDKSINRNPYWLCKCACGNIKSIRGERLRNGKAKSCGCLAKELSRQRMQTHGMTHTRLFKIWDGIKQRCFNTNDRHYTDYGGRGVTLHSPWLEFINFFNALNPNYLKHVEEFGEKNTSLDRWPNQSGNYEPGNLRWATSSEQMWNTRKSSNTENPEQHTYWRKRLQNCLNHITKRDCNRSPKTVNLLETYLGCFVEEFKNHIESQFLPEMTWANHGKGIGKWNYDHILGCNNFDLSKEQDRKDCFNYKNLRPMWFEDHKNKSTFRVSELVK